MKRNETVKAKKRFDEIIQNKKFYKNEYFVIYIMKKTQEYPNFGIAVSKKIGNAVIRNKLKRIVRTIIDNNKLLFQNYHDYIIMVRGTSLNIKYSILNESFNKLLKEKVNR